MLLPSSRYAITPLSMSACVKVDEDDIAAPLLSRMPCEGIVKNEYVS